MIPDLEDEGEEDVETKGESLHIYEKHACIPSNTTNSCSRRPSETQPITARGRRCFSGSKSAARGLQPDDERSNAIFKHNQSTAEETLQIIGSIIFARDTHISIIASSSPLPFCAEPFITCETACPRKLRPLRKTRRDGCLLCGS